MKEYSSAVYQNMLVDIMSRYEKYGNMSQKVMDFKIKLYDALEENVIPLTKDETLILRSLIKIHSDFSFRTSDLCKVLNINEVTLRSKINNIFCVLRHYFNHTEDFNIEYNNTINSNNYNVTIFDGGLSQNTIDILRIMNCVYLRDVTHLKMDEIKHFISKKQYEKLLDFMQFNEFLFDEQCSEFKLSFIK